MAKDTDNLPIVVYNAESQLRHPLVMFKEMMHDLSISRELAWRLFVRNVSSQYRQTLLGYIWIFLSPLMTTFTFMFLDSQKIINIGKTDIPYPAYVMLGTLLWQLFSETTLSPLRVVNQSKSFLSKIKFPREALLLTGVADVIFIFVIRLSLVLALFLWYRMPLPFTAVFAPIGVLSIMVLGLMIGIILTPLGVLYQDVERALGILLGIGFFFTPVVYPPPENWPASLITYFNPVSPLMTTTREMITTGTLTQIGPFLIILGATLFLLILGWIIYRLAVPHLIERLNI